MIDAIPFLSVIIALCIAYALGAYMNKTKPKSREQLRRELEAAQRRHGEVKTIRRLYQQATTEQIRKECA